MTNNRILVFTYSFAGVKGPQVWSRLFEEYIVLSEKNQLVVLADEVSIKENENITIVKIPKISLPILHVLTRTAMCFLESIKQRKNYDIVFIRILEISYITVSILSKKLFKKKLVVYVSNSEAGHIGIRKKIYKFLFKKMLSCADEIASSSEQVIKDAEKFLNYKIDRKKINIIRQGIDLSRFKPKNIVNNDNNLLCVARIQKIKRIENIIEAIPIVKKTFPNVKLKIIGKVIDQNYFAYLNELISKLECEKQVDFVGPIPYDEIVNSYNTSKIFISTSTGEGLSNVTFEAMACGKPVIVTKSGARTELVEDGVNGFHVEQNQPKVLAQKIINLLNNKDYYEKIGNAARKTVEEKCNWNFFFDDLNGIFKRISSDDKLQDSNHT